MFWTEEQTALEEDEDDEGLLEGVGNGEVNSSMGHKITCSEILNIV